MVEFRWIKISLFLMLLLHFTASVTGQYPPHSVVRDGDEVTLPCGNKIDDQNRCDKTDWIFAGSGYTAAVRLIERGQIGENAEAKSDRLSVTEKCSLVIKKVTAEDVGQYTCTQSGHYNAEVLLSVINMTEHKDDDEVMLKCSVSTDERCIYTVKWLYEGKDVDEDNKDMKTSQSDCSVTLTFPTTHLKQKSKYHELFKCKVTNTDTKQVQLFTFSPQTSGEKPGEDATTRTSTIRPTTKSRNTKTNSIETAVRDPPTKPEIWWLYVIVATGLMALVIIIVAIVRWKRTKGNKTQMDDNTGQCLNPAVTESGPETSRDTVSTVSKADPEDGVSYASISFSKKTESKGRVQVEHDADEGDAVTYSTVKASSSSAAASADPSDLYATVNKKK